MFGIGPMELIVIGIVAMVFIGPEKLPDLMRKFGKIFVQVRRQANEVRSSFNDVIHDAEREFELERIRELQKKLQSSSPQQVLDAALADNKTTATQPLQGPGLDEHGHPLPGFDQNGYALTPDHAAEHAPGQEYHEGHYVDGQFVKNADTFLAWDESMNRPLNELFPLKPEVPAETAAPAETTPAPAVAVAPVESAPVESAPVVSVPATATATAAVEKKLEAKEKKTDAT